MLLLEISIFSLNNDLVRLYQNYEQPCQSWHYLVKKNLFPIDALVVWCPTWSKNLRQSLILMYPYHTVAVIEYLNFAHVTFCCALATNQLPMFFQLFWQCRTERLISFVFHDLGFFVCCTTTCNYVVCMNVLSK